MTLCKCLPRILLYYTLLAGPMFVKMKRWRRSPSPTTLQKLRSTDATFTGECTAVLGII